MTDENNSTPKEKYPSVDVAYDIAVASFDSVAKRLDTLDGRIQTMLAFALTAILAVPTLGKARDLPLTSRWFQGAMVAVFIAISISVHARLTGKVKMLSPTQLWDGWLHLSEWQFKKDFIFFAAKAYKANTALLNRKWRLSVLSMLIFALALILLVVWISGSPT
jgi:hypothetical protein